MPWQRIVADVGTELDADTGLPAYRGVGITVPRQNGKTTLVLSWEVQRAIGWGKSQRIVYSAQSGNDARKKLLEDQVPLLDTKARRRALGISRILRGMGNEAVEFANGSRITLLASTEDSGHGKTVDLAIKDEFFADYDDRRDQTLVPAMATRADGQVVTASTMGTEDSVPLNRFVDQARAAVDAGRRDGIAYFEWSAPDGADPDDPAVWWECMPALGLTITEAVVRSAREILEESEFRRAFLNQRTGASERVIPVRAWRSACVADVELADPPTFALDMTEDRKAVAIAACGADGAAVELIAHRLSPATAIERAGQLQRRWGGDLVVAGRSPAGTLVGDLEAEGVTVRKASTEEFAAASGGFHDAVVESRLRIRQHPALEEASASAVRRSVGDAWVWARKGVEADVSPLIAVTLAHWGARRGEVGAGPSVYEERGLVVLG